MREMRALLVYVIGAAGLVVGIAVAANWAVNPSRHSPDRVSAETTGVAADSDAPVRPVVEDPTRQPVWIEPTPKYSYATPKVPVVKVDPAPPITHIRDDRHVRERSVKKPIRADVAASRPSRRSYRTAEQAPQMQMQILPLQHQAPN